MPRGGKNELDKAGEGSVTQESIAENETFREALSKEGFLPAKVGRKILSQGKRRETLKARGSAKSEK